MIRAGSYRHQIRIEQQSANQDGAGQPGSFWSTFLEVRAAVQHLPGKELFAAAHVGARLPTVFRIRYRAGVTAGMRIIFKQRVFEITSPPVDQEARGEELIIAAEERVGETA